MEGVGIFKWGDGRKYIGFFRGGKRNGFGMFFWPEQNKIYSGFWNDGMQSGYGKVYYNSMKEKCVFWVKGKKIKKFNSNEEMIDDINKSGNENAIRKIKLFMLSYDELLNLLVEL